MRNCEEIADVFLTVSTTMNPEMTPEALVNLLQLFEKAGIEVWLDGGWAVDAAIGEQTRPHKDADIILRVSDLPKLREILRGRGFEIQQGGTESNFVFADGCGLEVDVHAIVFDRDGNGIYRMETGSDWIFPSDGFAGRGVIQGIVVRCLSPEVQVLCHAHGYVPTEKDFQDMELLETRFGVELPPQLRRKSCSPIDQREADMQQDEKEIRQLVDKWMTATKAGDIETLLTLMSDDVVFLIPGGVVMHKAEFAAAARGQSGPNAPTFEGTSEIQEIKVFGDWAFMWTRLTVVGSMPDNPHSVKRTGHTLSILRKQDGKWVLARDANLLGPVSDE